MKTLFSNIACFLLITTSVYAQTPKLPGKLETAEYIRGKLLSHTTKDANDGLTEVSFNENNCTLLLIQENNLTVENYFSNLNANTITWDIFDPSPYDAPGRHAKLLRLKISSIAGKIARTCSGNKCKTQIACLWFKLDSIDNVEDFKKKMSKSVKHLIELCGGKEEEKDPFGN